LRNGINTRMFSTGSAYRNQLCRQKRIAANPGVLWKAQNVREHHGIANEAELHCEDMDFQDADG
jgi:hypothetical protein